jgi:DnaK suppressor protein
MNKKDKNPNRKAFKIITKKAPVIPPKPTEEELATNIGSAKNISFAMSIALQMKNQQRKADEARQTESEIVYRKRNVKYSDTDLENFRKKLLAARAEIAEKSSSVKNTIGLNTADDIEPDGGDGSTQSMRLDALSHMEKSSRTINDIDEALSRIDDRTYGVCMTCGNLIDKNRLVHSPFVKTCTGCQRKLETAM